MERRDFLILSAATVAAAGAAGAPAQAEEKQRMFAAAYLVKRKPGMSYEAYSAHAAGTHVPLALALPGLRSYRYMDFPPVDGEDQMFDGLAVLEFDSREAHDAALASPQGQAALADLPNYLEPEAMTALFGATVTRADSVSAKAPD